MSSLGDALTALKSIVLMQERLDVVRKEVGELGQTIAGVNDYAVSIDKRVIRIETMIEMSGRAPLQPRIEG